jgi:hypothetical protein
MVKAATDWHRDKPRRVVPGVGLAQLRPSWSRRLGAPEEVERVHDSRQAGALRRLGQRVHPDPVETRPSCGLFRRAVGSSAGIGIRNHRESDYVPL